MKFLQTNDFKQAIRPEHLFDLLAVEILENDQPNFDALETDSERIDLLLSTYPDNALEQCEATAIEMVSDSLRVKYDMAKVFEPFDSPLVWDDETTFNKGDIVQIGVNYYESLIDGNLDNAPADSPTAWVKLTRKANIIRAVLDILLYDLYSTAMPKNVPELRQKRYDKVCLWLYDCARGQKDPGLPLKVTTTGISGGLVQYGGHARPNVL